MELFNQHLAKLEKVLQDDTAVRERLAASGTMCYAADVRSIPMMDILIEKGVGKVLPAEQLHIGIPCYKLNSSSETLVTS